MATTRIVLTLTEEMHNELQRLAEERGVAVSYLVREAVAAYLERSKIRVRKVHPGWGGWRGGDQESEE